MGLRRDKDKAGVTTVTLPTVRIMPMGEGFIAVANVAGVNMRSHMNPTKPAALAELFRVIGNGNGDADIALELLANGSTLQELIDGEPALGAGDGD